MIRLFLVVGLVAVSVVLAEDNQPQLVTVPLQKAYVPVGFDSNDHVQIVVSGEFPDTCYKMGPITVRKDVGLVEIKQQAYHYGGVCLDSMVPFHQVVELDLMKAGRYEVRDGYSGKSIADLPVLPATRPEADDYLYAPVEEAMILEERGGKGPYLYLTGNFPNATLKIKEVKLLPYADVLVVQPIAEKVPAGTNGHARPRFETKIPLKQFPKGRFLLHVRSMNGKALNRIEEID